MPTAFFNFESFKTIYYFSFELSWSSLSQHTCVLWVLRCEIIAFLVLLNSILFWCKYEVIPMSSFRLFLLRSQVSFCQIVTFASFFWSRLDKIFIVLFDNLIHIFFYHVRNFWILNGLVILHRKSELGSSQHLVVCGAMSRSVFRISIKLHLGTLYFQVFALSFEFNDSSLITGVLNSRTGLVKFLMV